MFQKLLVVGILAFSFSTAFAKGAQNKGQAAGSYKRDSLKFDYEVFKKMDAKNKYAYVKAIRDGIIQISALQPQGKKSAMLDLQWLLIPYADAVDEKRCWNGGIAYKAENCDPRISAVPANEAASAFTSCGEGESRCSSALGFNLDDDNKAVGACYQTAKFSRATGICEKKLGGDKGLQNLVSALEKCQSQDKAYGVDCGKIKQAVTADTAGINDFCDNATYAKKVCARIKAKVADVLRKSGSDETDDTTPDVDPIQGGASCAAVEHKVASEQIKKSLGSGVDPKWLRLVMLTEKACGLTKFDVNDQLTKFGVCPSDQNSTQVSPKTESAINKMTSGGKLNKAEIGHFRDDFGVSPTEYKKLFCKSKDSLEFSDKMSKLSTGMDGPGYSRELSSYVLDMKPQDYQEFIAKINKSHGTYDSLSKYGDLRLQQESLLLTVAQANAKLTKNPEDHEAKKEKKEASAALQKMTSQADALRNSFVLYMSRESAYTGTPLSTALSKKDYDEFTKKFEEHSLNQQLGKGGLTSEGLKEKMKLMACARKAIKVTKKPGDDHSLGQISAKSNFDSKCSSQKIVAKPSDIFLGAVGSFKITTKDGKSCFYSNGSTSQDAKCKSSGSALNMIPGDFLSAKSQRNETQQCLEDLNEKYVIYEMSCLDSGADTNCPDGSAKSPQNQNCAGHGGVEQ